MSVKGDKYYTEAVSRAASAIRNDGHFECQVSSRDGKFGITLFDEHYAAGSGDITDAAGLALATLHEIAGVYGKPLAMQKTQMDLSIETLTGVMSIRIQEE